MGSSASPKVMSTLARSAIQSVLSQASGNLAEQIAHLLRGLEVVVLAVELETLGVGDQRAGLHAQQRVVALGVFAVGVVEVVRGEDGGADLAAISSSLGLVSSCSGIP